MTGGLAANGAPVQVRIVLGSTSRYRADLLRRLCDDFEQRAPGTDEREVHGEAPATRASRLAQAKAAAAANGLDDALVIGSDQVAELDGLLLDKPGTTEVAIGQLAACSGRVVHFHTAVCVIDTRTDQHYAYRDHTRVHFRSLLPAEIERYVLREQPLDCAGSFKCEGLGISLFERIENDDPTALIGLPMIALARLLRGCGLPIP
jgi:septum formation protein